MDDEMGGIDNGTELERALARLSEPEQRLYALAKQPIPLAEVAVRLGVTIAEADRRIGLLCATLGFADRAALQAGVTLAAASDGETPAETEVSARAERKYSRRAVLVAAGAGVAAVAGGGAWAAFGREGSKGGSAASAIPTPVATTTRTASAGIELDGAWEQAAFAPGLALDWPLGVYFMRLTDGAVVEAYRTNLIDSAPEVLAGGNVLLASTPGAEFGKLWHRRLARGFRWPGRELSLAAATLDWMLFEELEPRTGGGPGTPTGKFRMVDYGLRELLRFETPGGTQFQQRVLVSPDLTRAAIWGRESDRGILLRVNLESGAIETRFDFQMTPTLGLSGATPVQIPRTDDFMFELAVDSGSQVPAPPRQFRTSWDGDWSQLYSLPGDRIHSWASTGHLSLAEVAVRGFTGGGGEGGGENWPAVVVRNKGGQVTGRVLSAALYYGDNLSRRWLANGSGFVAMVDNGRTDGPGWDRIGYAIFGVNGDLLERLPTPEYDTSHQVWWRSLSNMGPTPHPTDPFLIAFGRTAVYNLATKQWTRANFANPDGPADIDPWSGRADELVISVPHHGHGGGGIPALLPPASWPAPLPIPPIRVSGDGDCLNVRIAPSLQAKAVTCLADGTTVEVATPPRVGGNTELPPSSFARGDDGAWAYITDGKVAGWVSSAYLRWDGPQFLGT